MTFKQYNVNVTLAFRHEDFVNETLPKSRHEKSKIYKTSEFIFPGKKKQCLNNESERYT